MIKEIINYIDVQLALTGYFQKQWGLVELVGIDGKTAPRKYCGKSEWKQVLDFDSKHGHCYIRRNGNISVAENDAQNSISCAKLYDISIPLKLVAVIKRKFLSEDNEFSADVAADTVMKYVSLQSHTLATAIKAKRVNIGLVSRSVNMAEILRGEKQEINRELPYEYVMFSLDLNVVITSRRECIVEECDDVNTCENLRNYLMQEQKDCILNGYDFSDPTNVDRLTDQQQTDLIAALCTGGCSATYTVFVDGTSVGTVTVDTSDSNDTINLTW
jgi:hypothetical protein